MINISIITKFKFEGVEAIICTAAVVATLGFYDSVSIQRFKTLLIIDIIGSHSN